MKFRHLCVLSFFSLSCAVPLNNLPRNVSHIPSTPACPHYCTNTAFNASLAEWYVCGDDRLGPVRLPSRLPLGGLFDTYDRFGGLCPGEFLQKWFDTTTGYYRYPTANGFQVDTAGSPIKGNVTLPVGLLIDRFGSEYGTYVSPEGAPYMQRALPPSNLDTPKDNFGFPYNYHVYNVTKSFTASSGPIAGWFGQPGQGVQYQLSSRIVDLLSEGFIVPIDLSKF